MDDRQWQSDGPVRRGGVTDPDLQNDSDSSRSPDENQNRLVEEAEEVEQGPRGGQRPLRQDKTSNNGDDEDYDSSKVEDEDDVEEEEVDGNSGAYSPELDGHIRDSPTPSPSPTVSEGLVSPEGTPHGDAGPPQGFAHSLVASLQELGEQGEHPLLPQCLHQIAESYMREEDYERAVRFIQLERLYHERLLSNLAALQQQWERRRSLVGQCQDGPEDRDTDLDAEHLEKLRHICRTHRQPAWIVEKCELSKVQRNSVIRETQEGEQNLNTQELSCSSGKVMEDQSTSEAQQEVIQHEDCSSTASQSHQSEQQYDPSSPAVTDSSSSPACEDAGAEEESASMAASHRDATPEPHSPMDTALPDDVEAQPVMEGTGDTVDTGQDVVESVPHTKQEDGGEVEEALKLEEGGADQLPLEQEVPEKTAELELEENGNGVESLDIMHVSMLDDMAKRIQVEEITPAAGLVSILKRRVSLEGANSSVPAAPKPVSKRKVRFHEPDEGLDHDEVGGDSWLLLLLLCLATVVISVGGTALYCTFGDAQSSVCTDFSHNMDFYIGRVQRGMDELKHWLSPSS
ncbi:consortin-like [Sinocyclocheilus grahami]|uniref:Consortin-like n=1 Tax=Sinocyclocheilus grahami TaxID=75366 RepID=A0A672SE75_SINGR|nr:PREDICTED: consortin-like [Sinocyclocheilus grahami]XP_016129534.1 PREDICTED: consortin-like [Sinocyclocheilus grahami]